MLSALQQLVTRIADDLAEAVDELVEAGLVASRSAAVRIGLRRIVTDYRRELVGQQIVAGYRAVPQTDAEVGWVDESTVRMIGDEPW
jgi:Arc/MetJ-type ribon-helix-helix transcriptional regulator